MSSPSSGDSVHSSRHGAESVGGKVHAQLSRQSWEHSSGSSAVPWLAQVKSAEAAHVALTHASQSRCSASGLPR